MFLDDWIWIPALVVVLVGFLIVVWRAVFNEKHLARDMGDGSVKVDCPDEDQVRLIHLKKCEFFSCPNCGKKLQWPKRENTWSSVDAE